MRKRLQEFALSLHSEKTRLIEFGRFAVENRKRRGLGKPETFTFLGFTFICSKTRRGKFQIRRKSRRDRMQAKLQAIKQELRRSMHQPIPQQGRWLQQVVTGYFNYHAVPTNRSSELGPYGSMRGARGDSRPYRESRVSERAGPVLTQAV
jgi:RNA-directed DNA polymerase